MYLKKTINNNEGNAEIGAEHVIKEINLTGGVVSFLLQSFAPSSGDEERLPFCASWYHCSYDSSKELYLQAFNYLLSLEEFSGADMVDIG